ncbi:MAG TPA: DUF1266 domain-containing protein [Cellvibrio sp.]|nr:DUF1266 domain-containing protein [Cellvibrio sp.]
MKNLQYKYQNPDNLTQHQLWLIATSALLSQLNLHRHDTLLALGNIKTPEVIHEMRSCLQRDWSIKTKKNLLDTLKNLPSSETFTAILNNWESVSSLELNALDKVHTSFGDAKSIFKMVDFYQFGLGGSGDLAWHLGRNAWLIRQAVLIGLINEDTAWELLEVNGNLIRRAFNSWEEFGISYTIGAQYWRKHNFTEVSIKNFKDVLSFLLINKDSPWNHVAW